MRRRQEEEEEGERDRKRASNSNSLHSTLFKTKLVSHNFCTIPTFIHPFLKFGGLAFVHIVCNSLVFRNSIFLDFSSQYMYLYTVSLCMCRILSWTQCFILYVSSVNQMQLLNVHRLFDQMLVFRDLRIFNFHWPEEKPKQNKIKCVKMDKQLRVN